MGGGPLGFRVEGPEAGGWSIGMKVFYALHPRHRCLDSPVVLLEQTFLLAGRIPDHKTSTGFMTRSTDD